MNFIISSTLKRSNYGLCKEYWYYISQLQLRGWMIGDITICPRSSDPFYMFSYYIKWVITSKKVRLGVLAKDCLIFLQCTPFFQKYAERNKTLSAMERKWIIFVFRRNLIEVNILFRRSLIWSCWYCFHCKLCWIFPFYINCIIVFRL